MKSQIFLCIAAIALTLGCRAQKYESKQFTIDRLADGVYAVIAKNGSAAVSNAGIVDLGDVTLVFDALMTPQAARDLRAAAETLTGHPVTYLVNSHWHNDHVGGNQVFTDATIVSTSNTRKLMQEYLPEELEYYAKVVPNRLETLRQMDTTVMSAHARDEHRMWWGYYRALATYQDSLHLRYPDVTFSDSFTIEGKSRKALLYSYGTGHTEGDLFMYLPADKIAFLGDLLFIKNQPWLGDGDPDKWSAYLDSVGHMDIDIAVPGHGPVGTLKDTTELLQYMRNVNEVARTFHHQGRLPEDAGDLPSPAPFDGWFLSRFYKYNVINEYHRLYGD